VGGFSVRQLSRDPARALEAVVRVGPQPVGVLLIGHGRYALTANSARFTAPGKPHTVSVVSTAAALACRPALAGTVRAGAFPREFGYDPATAAVLLTNFDSGHDRAVHDPHDSAAVHHQAAVPRSSPHTLIHSPPAFMPRGKTSSSQFALSVTYRRGRHAM
jgi:hypothetical protein